MLLPCCLLRAWVVFLGRIQVPADVLHVHSGVLAPHSSMGCDCSARASLYASASAKLRAMLARKFCVCRHGIAVSLALFLTCNQHSGNERACMVGCLLSAGSIAPVQLTVLQWCLQAKVPVLLSGHSTPRRLAHLRADRNLAQHCAHRADAPAEFTLYKLQHGTALMAVLHTHECSCLLSQTPPMPRRL